MSNVLQELIDRITDNYTKSPDSHNYKFMELSAKAIQDNEDTITKVGEWRDIDQAEGKILDKAGSNVKQDRGQLPDETYRILIKSKIKRSFSDGSIDTLIDFLSFLLQIPPTDVTIRELWAEGKPATLFVNVPTGPIGQTGLTLNQFGQLVNKVVAAGVRAEVLAEGTFSFSSNYTTSETDANAGFDGGTLGYTYNPAQEADLPI